MKKIVLSLACVVSCAHAMDEKRIATIAQAWQKMKYSHAVHYMKPCETGGRSLVRDLMFNATSDMCSMKRRCDDDANKLVPVTMMCGKGSLLEKIGVVVSPRATQNTWDIRFPDEKTLTIASQSTQQSAINLFKEFDVTWAHNSCLVAVNKYFCIVDVKHGSSKHVYLFKIESPLYSKMETTFTFLTDLGMFKNADCADISDDGTKIVMAEQDGTLHYFRLKDE